MKKCYNPVLKRDVKESMRTMEKIGRVEKTTGVSASMKKKRLI